MGHRIRVCAMCGITPEDGETMWEMGNEVWCDDCAEKGYPDEEDDSVNN